MADQARIRTYQPGDADLKLARFSIGKAQMEGLAVANRRTYISPQFLAVWFGASAMLIQWLKWWPDPELPWWTYLKPIPALAAFLVPLMFLIDLYNRPYFEEQATQVLRRPDILDLNAYYTRSPASGFYMLEYSGKFVGLIAVDASLDSASNATFTSNGNAKQVEAIKKQLSKRGTAEVAVIRHFYVMEEYRVAGVQEDLLQYAVDQTFKNDSKVKVIRIVDSALSPWVGSALAKEGFVIEKTVRKIGTLGWKVQERALARDVWKQRRSSKA